jgi:hypothetical protein
MNKLHSGGSSPDIIEYPVGMAPEKGGLVLPDGLVIDIPLFRLAVAIGRLAKVEGKKH